MELEARGEFRCWLVFNKDLELHSLTFFRNMNTGKGIVLRTGFGKPGRDPCPIVELSPEDISGLF